MWLSFPKGTYEYKSVYSISIPNSWAEPLFPPALDRCLPVLSTLHMRLWDRASKGPCCHMGWSGVMPPSKRCQNGPASAVYSRAHFKTWGRPANHHGNASRHLARQLCCCICFCSFHIFLVVCKTVLRDRFFNVPFTDKKEPKRELYIDVTFYRSTAMI